MSSIGARNRAWFFIWAAQAAFVALCHLQGQVCCAQAPASAPEEVNLAELSKDRSQWPGEVSLLESTEFPIIIGGKESGKMGAPKGAKVRLIELLGSQAKVAYNGVEKLVLTTSTDLVEQVSARRRADTKGAGLAAQAPLPLAGQPAQKPTITTPVATPAAPPVPATVRLTVLSGEPKIKQNTNQSPVFGFVSKGKLVAGSGNVRFEFELENLTANPLDNVRLVISVLDKTTGVDKQGQPTGGNLSVARLNGGSLDGRRRVQYSEEVMVSFDDKSKHHPVEAYSVDVYAGRQLLLERTYPPTAQKMMDDKKKESDDYKKWSGGMKGTSKHNKNNFHKSK